MPGWFSWWSVQLQLRSWPWVCEFEPCPGLRADGSEPGACFRFCCLPLTLTFPAHVPNWTHHCLPLVHSVLCNEFLFCFILGCQFYEPVSFSEFWKSLRSPVAWPQCYLSNAIRSLEAQNVCHSPFHGSEKTKHSDLQLTANAFREESEWNKRHLWIRWTWHSHG